MKLKEIVCFLFAALIISSPQTVWAQQKDSLKGKHDTSLHSAKPNQPKTILNSKDSLLKKNKKDSIFNAYYRANSKPTLQKDSLSKLDMNSKKSFNTSLVDTSINKDSTRNLVINTHPKFVSKNQVDWALQNQRFINVHQSSMFFLQEVRTSKGKEVVFYSLCFLVLLWGLFKTIYKNYFKNLFRVFFNTSLRKNQITEQLLQAQLPSLFLNLFFIITAGVYISILLSHYNFSGIHGFQKVLPFAILAIAVIYSIKYCILKFIGWIGGIQSVTDNYIFIIFLVNKVAGVLLLPFIILFSFASDNWTDLIIKVSFLMLVFLLLTRYLKSFGSFERKMPINQFHFLIYLIGVEILPLLIFYKIIIGYLI
jgi:hypothetical protein